jgi:hypothetical protein
VNSTGGGCDHHGTEAGASHDQALIHQDPQRLAHRLAARGMVRHQLGLGRQ